MHGHTRGHYQPTQPPAAPGGVHSSSSGSLQSKDHNKQTSVEENRAGEGDANAAPSGAQADDAKKNDLDTSDRVWPTPGDAVLTTDEARLHLYQMHDIFLKERYVQKLVSELQKLDGRRVPKDGGGVELQITQSSLDRYAAENPQKKNAADMPLDPNDKLFNRLRDIAQSKPFKYSIDGAAPSMTETPPAASSSTPQPEPPAAEKKLAVEPTADVAPTPDVEMVPAALYESTLQRLETMEEMNIKLYDTLDSAYDKIADMNTELLALTKHVTEKLESPATILNSMTGTLKAANNLDDRTLERPASSRYQKPQSDGFNHSQPHYD